MIRALTCASLMAAAGCAVAQSNTDNELARAFGQSTIVVEADEHRCYRFDVYLAETAAQQRRGLMFVREMPQMTGMLFIYAESRILSMWMKNTYISLDMLFIREDGSVESIAAETEPLSLRSISSGGPVMYVLELNAGVTEALGIGTDSRVQVEAPDYRTAAMASAR